MPTSITKPARRRAKADGYERQEHGERTRQRIIQAAIELFAENGWRGTGIAALGERVEMTGPGLLYYFGSKEQLLRDVVAERERSDEIDQWDQIYLRDLPAQGRHTLTNRLLTQLYAVLSAESIGIDRPLNEFFTDRYRRSRMFVRRMLELEIAEGRARADIDLDQLSYEIVSFTLGLEMQWLIDPEGVDLVAIVERYYDQLTRRIAAPDQTEQHAD